MNSWYVLRKAGRNLFGGRARGFFWLLLLSLIFSSSAHALRDATVINTYEEVGHLSGPTPCTVTMIAPKYFLTSSSCISFNVMGGTGNTITLKREKPVGRIQTVTRTVNWIKSLGDGGAGDVALGRLITNVPDDWKLASIAMYEFGKGQRYVYLGTGCTGTPGAGVGTRRYRIGAYPSLTGGCAGDQGGPIIDWVNGTHYIGGLISGNIGRDGKITLSNVSQYRERIFGTIRASEQGLEPGIDRMGHDYWSTTLDASVATSATAGAKECKVRCEKDAICRSFTYVHDWQACFLKGVLAAPVAADPNLISGLVSGVPSRAEPFRITGRTYAAINTTLDGCKSECANSSSCRAYTFFNSSFTCELKTTGSAAKTACPYGGCSSGIKRPAAEPVDRAGKDYKTLTLSTQQQCQDQCAKDGKCHSFAYVTGTRQCYLKSAIPDIGGNNGSAYSNFRRGFDYDTDRPGRDLRSFAISDATGHACSAACENESYCYSWTLVPRAANRAGRCFLKSGVPDPVKNYLTTGMISGIKGMDFF